MSRAPIEAKDELYPSMTWGRGRWPSLQYGYRVAIGRATYGSAFPFGADLNSLYGQAFQFADKVLNAGRYSGGVGPDSQPMALKEYLDALANGAARLDFVLYVPPGYARVDGLTTPNLEETEDSAKVFTARFAGGAEVW